MSGPRVQPNKQTQNTNPSKMNGDNLTQLKYLKQAELSPRVQSYNMATRVQMTRQINWGYREQALNLEKMKKGQYIYYKQLKRLQQEKRSLQQQSYRYKQEEARMEVVREKRDRKIRKVLDDYEEKSREIIADIMNATRKRRRRPAEDDLEDDEGEGQGESEGQGQRQHEGHGQSQGEREHEFQTHDQTRRFQGEDESQVSGGKGKGQSGGQGQCDEGQGRTQGEGQNEVEKKETIDKGDDLVSEVQREMEEVEAKDKVEEDLYPVPPQGPKFRQVWKPADAEKYSERRGSVYIEYMYVKPGHSTLVLEALDGDDSRSKSKRRRSRAYSLTQGDSDFTIERRRLSLRRRSKALAVNLNDPDDPRIVLKLNNPVSDSEELPPLRTVKNRTKQPPPNSVLVENFHENGVDAIVAVETANNNSDSVQTSEVSEGPKVFIPRRPSKQFRALPVISENGPLDEETEPESEPVEIAQLMIISRKDGVTSPPESTSSSGSLRSEKNAKKKQISNVEYIKLSQKERETEKQTILDLPYTAYTMTKDGAVIPLLGPPKPMNTDPPTNIERYKRDKLLVKQLSKQRVENETLKEFLERIHEDVEAMPPPPNPNPDISIETMAKLIELGEVKDDAAKVKVDAKLPLNMTIFLKNKFDELPDDLDPNSIEALAKCKYLREFDVEAAKEARKTGRRQSSWQVKTQTVGGAKPSGRPT